MFAFFFIQNLYAYSDTFYTWFPLPPPTKKKPSNISILYLTKSDSGTPKFYMFRVPHPLNNTNNLSG